MEIEIINKFLIFRHSCNNDFLEIYDSTDSFRLCGSEVKSLKDKFCGNVIYISYRANATVTSFTTYRGFKLYYES